MNMTELDSAMNSAAHLAAAPTIIDALFRIQQDGREKNKAKPHYLSLPLTRQYQHYIFEKFSDIINTPSVYFISKSDQGWLIVGDNRNEIAAKIALVIERYGLGVGMLVLHAQQMNTGYIPIEISIDGEKVDLTQPTQDVYGSRSEHVISVPIRKYRNDNVKLAELDIVKPSNLLDRSQIVKHKGDKWDCRYCSAREQCPKEVVITIKGSRFGLSRNYSFGFTYAPFGNPLTVVHFLAWDQAEKPLNMNRTPMTVTDLVVLTRLINISLINFFAGTDIKDFPVIDGVSNGWAGNSIFHQHFQFFQPEFIPPTIQSEHLTNRKATLERDDVKIHRLSWEIPVYKIVADESINVGLVGNDLAGAWRLLSEMESLKPGDKSDDGFEVEEAIEMRFHTQNIYVPGKDVGKTAVIMLRNRKLIDFDPKGAFVNKSAGRKAQPKSNIGVIEASGVLITDDADSFKEICNWDPADVSRQFDLMLKAICPDEKKIALFENAISGLFPPE